MSRALVIAAALSLVACSSEDATGGPPRAGEGDDATDAGSNADVRVDPTGGRTSTAQSCFAACQNVALTCIPKGSATTKAAFLELSTGGCKGMLDGQELELKCGDITVCIDGACVPGTFNAFQFSYTAKDGKDTVCNRD